MGFYRSQIKINTFNWTVYLDCIPGNRIYLAETTGKSLTRKILSIFH